MVLTKSEGLSGYNYGWIAGKVQAKEMGSLDFIWYADVFFLTELLRNYFLLCLTAAFEKRNPFRLRLILAAAAGFLPVFLQTLLWYLTANFTSAAAEMLEIKTVAGMLKSAGTTLGVLLSVILCFALLVIISTTLVLTTSTGV